MAEAADRWVAGQPLAELTKMVTQEDINLYARASGDHNPIHIDPEFARGTPLGGTVAHGMLVLAYVSQMLTRDFGRDWLNAGSLNIRFKAPARPGDTLRIGAKVSKIDAEPGRQIVSCQLQCINQSGEVVLQGEAKVRIKNEDRG
jgi:3-hydroxybutyryl-CoA dehydratase